MKTEDSIKNKVILCEEKDEIVQNRIKSYQL